MTYASLTAVPDLFLLKQPSPHAIIIIDEIYVSVLNLDENSMMLT